MISYKPFRVLVADRNLKVSDIAQELKISSGTMAKLNAKSDENEVVSLTVIEKLCNHFGVTIDKNCRNKIRR